MFLCRKKPKQLEMNVEMIMNSQLTTHVQDHLNVSKQKAVLF